ncbi:MAG: exopolyphosphatase [Gammaproteobacteria bacterium]|nr:exopolyphosphatase [Gammaproteobacteria bacterium]
MANVIRIGNCSGFYGDRLAAAREMVDGGEIDVLTGDYLAELTMAILYSQKESRGQNLGYVGTFLKQVRDVASDCKKRGIKIVSNAGGLNPRSMASEIEGILLEQGLDMKVAYIEGDDISKEVKDLQQQGENFFNIDTGKPLSENLGEVVSANTYLGSWSIKEALDRNADIVVCPRVTDAAVVIGPAAWKFNWNRDDYDALAGALTAGHIIECGAQCCGGNYSFFEEVPSFLNIGYPIAEIEEDGTFTITKHDGTGGLISVGTVTAQLLYEIKSPAYINPDVVAHFDTLTLEQESDNRVKVKGIRGSSPPQKHKVCANVLGTNKQSLEVLLTGLDIEKKSELFLEQIFHNLGGKEQFDDVDIQLIRSDKKNPTTNEEAHAALRITISDKDGKKLGRLLQAKVTELGLATIPGNTSRGGSGYNGGPVISHWPTLISSSKVLEKLYIDGEVIDVLPTQQMNLSETYYQTSPIVLAPPPKKGDQVRIEFGRLFGTRSGDKGGAANCGVWAKNETAYRFLYDFLTVDKFKELLPDLERFHVERFELPNIRALNFFVHNILGEGVSSNHRIDKQAKSLGEYLGTKSIEVPETLLGKYNEKTQK